MLIQRLRTVGRSLGLDLKRHSRLRRTIDLLVSDGRDPFFIQVGANDGLLLDDLHGAIVQHNLGGIVVEPVRDYFNSLVQTYVRQRRVVSVNAAIHPTATEATIYRVVPERVTVQWQHGLASFSRAHLLKHGVPDDAIAEEQVPCFPFGKLLEYVPSGRSVDVLMIDTEGFDAEILRMVDLETLRPKIIRFEAKHSLKQDLEDITHRLRRLDYAISFTDGDCTAIDRRLASGPLGYLRKRWSQDVF